MAFANQAAIAKQLDDWQVLPQPQRLSELYFVGSTHLPAAVRVGVAQKLAFTVHNREHQPTTYRYKLMVISAGGSTTQSLGSGTLTLAHDQSQTINQTFHVPPIGSQVAIKVELEYEGLTPGAKMPSTKNQSIHYWVKVVGL